MMDFSNIENSEVKFYLWLPDIERTADNRKLSGYNAKQQNKLLIKTTKKLLIISGV